MRQANQLQLIKNRKPKTRHAQLIWSGVFSPVLLALFYLFKIVISVSLERCGNAVLVLMDPRERCEDRMKRIMFV